MAEQRAQASPEDLAKTMARAGVPQSVFFYVALGVISAFRKTVHMAVNESCPPEETTPATGEPPVRKGQAETVTGQSPAKPGGSSGAASGQNVPR